MGNPSITSGQRKQIVRFMEDGLDALTLDKDGAQRIIGHGGDMQTKLKDLLREFSVSNQFANEEVSSKYGYPEGYQVKPIAEQIEILMQLFPELGTADESIAEGPVPSGAEGWFAIPRWEKLASTYGEAVEKVLDLIGSKRKFYNYREGQLGPQYLKPHDKTSDAFQTLGDEQKEYNILIVPCQFGLHHRGQSVRRAREVMNASEFGLGAFAIGCMLLTHPEREVQWKQLHVDCVGDEFSPAADGKFLNAPFFNFLDDKLKFNCLWIDNPNAGGFGAASAFLRE